MLLLRERTRDAPSDVGTNVCNHMAYHFLEDVALLLTGPHPLPYKDRFGNCNDAHF